MDLQVLTILCEKQSIEVIFHTVYIFLTLIYLQATVDIIIVISSSRRSINIIHGHFYLINSSYVTNKVNLKALLKMFESSSSHPYIERI